MIDEIIGVVMDWNMVRDFFGGGLVGMIIRSQGPYASSCRGRFCRHYA